MPVIDQIQVAYQLVRITADYEDKTGTATFKRFDNGNYVGNKTMTVVGDELVELFGKLIENYPLAYYVTDAVYEMALRKGVITGQSVEAPQTPVEAPTEPEPVLVGTPIPTQDK